LADARVLVTGGSSGIGLATARRVVAAGDQAVLVGRDHARLSAARSELGEEATETLALDITDESAVEAALSRIGALDHLVTAAAGTVRGRFMDMDTAAARGLFESKYWGQYHCVRHAAPRLGSDDSVVLFSGWISRKPMVGTSAPAAVDAAVEALARVLSELPRRSRTVASLHWSEKERGECRVGSIRSSARSSVRRRCGRSLTRPGRSRSWPGS
jgi:NAD(P)-dependent dehydrogenase (short-subunit alcohol dehydrogenase family)